MVTQLRLIMTLTAQTPDGTHKEDWLDIGFKAQDVEALEVAAGYNKRKQD
jgi:hypothetical protein